MANEKAIRVGVLWRTSREEAEGKRGAYQKYLDCVRAAGGEPVEVSLSLSREKLAELARSLDAFVLPGSPADVDPQWYHAPRHPQCAEPDSAREQADFALLDHAFAERKPVLAICYGVQSLNVWLGGTLVQDIASELDTELKHDWDRKSGEPEPFHGIQIENGTKLAQLAGTHRSAWVAPGGATSDDTSHAPTPNLNEAQVNSSHHQAIHRVGRGLRVSAHSLDGVIEAVEWTQGEHWVVGVQWHPERMRADALTRALFAGLKRGPPPYHRG